MPAVTLLGVSLGNNFYHYFGTSTPILIIGYAFVCGNFRKTSDKKGKYAVIKAILLLVSIVFLFWQLEYFSISPETPLENTLVFLREAILLGGIVLIFLYKYSVCSRMIKKLLLSAVFLIFCVNLMPDFDFLDIYIEDVMHTQQTNAQYASDIASLIPPSEKDSVFAYGMADSDSSSAWYRHTGITAPFRHCDWHRARTSEYEWIRNEIVDWLESEESPLWIVVPSSWDIEPAEISQIIEQHYCVFGQNEAYILYSKNIE